MNMQNQQKKWLERADFTIYRFHELPSTNTYLKDHCRHYQDYTIIWAQKQTQGRGRFSRKWCSLSGKDLTFSILLPLARIPSHLWPNITQIAALAMVDALAEYAIESFIKWPNDLVINHKKLAGILGEITGHAGKSYAILGVGININSDASHLTSIDRPATSICQETNRAINPDDLLIKLCEYIINYFHLFIEQGYGVFCQRISTKLANLGKNLTINLTKDEKHNGQIIDINEDGTLRFKTDRGTILDLSSGELSFSPLPD